MLIIGHRGNTWRIIKRYLASKTPVIEVDARYMNGDFYAVHGPPSIKRPSLPGKVMAWIDYRFFYRDPILKPLKVRDILRYLDGRVDVMIDIKQRGIEDRIIDLIEETGYRGRVYITTELHPVLKRLRELVGRNYTLIASINILAVDMPRIALDAEADMVSIHLSIIDEKLVDEFHSQNIKVLSWTINDLETYEYLKRIGVDGIVTDIPSLFIDQLYRV